LLLLTGLIDLLLAAFANALNEEDLSSFWRAFAWTTSQLLAGGSSFGVKSSWGHFLEIVLQLWGITVVAALAGSFAAFFHRRSIERGTANSSGSAV
jgi:3-isopropylmalate dehydratase small subunit